MIAGVRRIRGLSLIAIFARTLLAGSEAFAVDTWYAKATIEYDDSRVFRRDQQGRCEGNCRILRGPYDRCGWLSTLCLANCADWWKDFESK